jgi:hypothetical protein
MFVDTARMDQHILQQFTTALEECYTKWYPQEVAAMRTYEASHGLSTCTGFSDDFPTCSLNTSIDLANADNVDVGDATIGIALFHELLPVTAQHWYFVFPNVLVQDGDCEHKGLIVQLQVGRTISWDGNCIRHCTSVCDMKSTLNHVYGIHIAAAKRTAILQEKILLKTG